MPVVSPFVSLFRVITWYMGSGIKGLKRAGIRDHTALGFGITTCGIGISSIFRGIRDQGSHFCGFGDQNSHHFWDQGSKFWVKIWDHLRKNIPRYDPAYSCESAINSSHNTRKSAHTVDWSLKLSLVSLIRADIYINVIK